MNSYAKLLDLVKDRPLYTSEIHSANDFYGNATILKRYVGFPLDYKIKASIEHGVYLNEYTWDVDLYAELPAIFTPSPYRLNILKKKTKKAIFMIGPILAYAPHLLDEDSLRNEKQRLGKNLLVFPAHSTHHVNVNYDIKNFCDVIKEIGKDFNSIRICLYWKDILQGHAEEYAKYAKFDFEFVTAGHIFDPLFLSRLKSIIELSTITMSNQLGTHIGYCILLKKPHYLYECPMEYSASSEDIIERDGGIIGHDLLKTFQVFSDLRYDITSEQKELVEKYWGLSEIKSVEEMQMIFQATEDMFKKGKHFYMSNIDVLTEQAFDYLNKDKNTEALFLFENCIKVNPEIHLFQFCRSMALTKLAQPQKTIETSYELNTKKPKEQKMQDSISQSEKLFYETSQLRDRINVLKSIFNNSKNFYGLVILNPGTLSRIATSLSVWHEILSFHDMLATDEYVKYVDAFYRECIKRFGSDWYYMDIVNVLYAASKTIQPRNYLEIGVRRGRSVCVVARGCPTVNITAFDMWIQNYAGMENPGPDFVRSELRKHGHIGNITFINGDSHQTIPAFFKQNPGITFDMITVDGDHTEEGALDDLINVIPHLSVGGVLVFDDIAHPAHPYLLNVWKKALRTFPYLAGFEYTELGYGVAFAIRKSE